MVNKPKKVEVTTPDVSSWKQNLSLVKKEDEEIKGQGEIEVNFAELEGSRDLDYLIAQEMFDNPDIESYSIRMPEPVGHAVNGRENLVDKLGAPPEELKGKMSEKVKKEMQRSQRVNK